MTELLSTHRGLRPNRPRLVAVLVTGCLVGLAPYARFLGRWDLTAMVVGVLFLALAILTAFKSVGGLPTNATEPPGMGEWVLAVGMATGNVIVASLIGFLSYAIGFWGIRLWNLLASAVSLPSGNPDAWGFWLSLPVALTLALAMIAVAAEKVTPMLYPSTAGARSVFFPLLSQPVKLAALGISFAAGVVIVSWLPPSAGWISLATVTLFYAGMPLDRLGEPVATRRGGMMIDVAERVLQEAGYQVVRSPRTGKPEIDPLIRNVTLLASAGAEAFALELLEVDSDGPPVQWTAASGVRTAASILQHEQAASRNDLPIVRPILVVVGGTLGTSLTRFSEREGVPVVHVARASEPGEQGAEGQRVELIASFKEVGLSMPARVVGDRGEVMA